MTDLPPVANSYWLDTSDARTPVPLAPPQPPPTEVDVAVLGAGIAGLTTAYLLAARGRTVAVLEARHPAAGTTGHTTAKVTAQHGMIYGRLVRRFGSDTARAYGQSQLAALSWLAEAVKETGIDCDWEQRDSYVYAHRADRLEDLRAEARTAAELGLPAEFSTDVELPYEVAGAVRFTGMAQFHPGRWLAGLAEAVTARGGVVCSGVRAVGLDEGDPSRVRTTGGEVRARDVVVATHYPIFDRAGFFARLTPTRDLVVAGPVPASTAPPHMYLAVDGSRSVRTAPLPGYDDRRLLIVSGGHYRTGTTSAVLAKHAELADWARRVLRLGEVTHRWSAHDLSTVDGLPYVGRYHPRTHRVWVATGFGAWGMTNGTLAGLVLADLITGTDNPWAKLYDPNRVNLTTAVNLVRDAATAGGLLVGGHLGALGGPAAGALRPGEGTVVWRQGHPTAVARADDGTLSAVSARCTHLGCIVRWNDAERSWDCPCHGSRFDPQGEVLHGPAVEPLRRVKPSDD
jgi:glycine/D-amino acid oxidase-like deaminating enzyme/nitrite reductase/ring-hydroxylating ferredoxin subunit